MGCDRPGLFDPSRKLSTMDLISSPYALIPLAWITAFFTEMAGSHVPMLERVNAGSDVKEPSVSGGDWTNVTFIYALIAMGVRFFLGPGGGVTTAVLMMIVILFAIRSIRSHRSQLGLSA